MYEFPAHDGALQRLNAKRAELAAIFAEAGPDLDMEQVKSLSGTTTDKVEEIRNRNAEIDDLAIEIERYEVLAKGYELSEGDDEAEQGADGGAAAQTKSLGQLIAESPARTERKRPTEIDVDLKAVLSTSAGWAPDVVRGPRLVEFATRPIELLDLIPMTTTTQSAVSYMEETTFTNAAAETAEGAAKPEAELVFTERTSPVRKPAVTIPVTDEQLDDVSQLRQYLDNRLGFMVQQRLSGQIISGNGTAPNLRGILNVAGIQTQAKGGDPTPDAVYKAMTLAKTTGQAMPDAVVFNPLDWQDVRLLRTADGIYIWGSPSEPGPARIWGLPVIEAQAMTQNTALVGAFKQYSELALRSGLVVESGFVNDDFRKNQQTLRAEMRAALVVYRPAAFVSVTGI